MKVEEITAILEHPDLPAENRARDFFSCTSSRTRITWSQPDRPHPETVSTTTTTAPGLFSFLSKDPIGISGGLNQYVFCHNDPVNYRDPFGLCEEGVTSKSIGLIGAGIAVGGGGFVSLEVIWDTDGNVGLALSGDLGAGVEVGLKSELLDLAIGHLPDSSEGNIAEQSGFGTTARGHVLLGVKMDDPLGPDSKPEFSINPSIGGGIYMTGKLVIPVWGPTLPKVTQQKNYGLNYMPDF